jgi:hypothetical protein
MARAMLVMCLVGFGCSGGGEEPSGDAGPNWCGEMPACVEGGTCVKLQHGFTIEPTACQGPCLGPGDCTTWASEPGTCVELYARGTNQGAVCLPVMGATCATWQCEPSADLMTWRCVCP